MNLAQIDATLLDSESLFLQGSLSAAREKLLTITKVNPGHSKANELLVYISGNQGSIEIAIMHVRVAKKP